MSGAHAVDLKFPITHYCSGKLRIKILLVSHTCTKSFLSQHLS